MEISTTQKSIPLSQDQQKLINDNFTEIKEKLKQVLKRNRKRIFGKVSDNYLGQAVSFIPDVVREFDSTKVTPRINVQDFIVSRCIFRLIDQHRKLNRHIRISRAKRDLIAKIAKELSKETDKDILWENIENKLIELGLKPDEYAHIDAIKCFSMEKVHDKLISNRLNGFSEVDWQDFAKNMLDKSEVKFKISDPNLSSTIKHSLNVRKSLVQNYIIKNITGESRITLGQISKEVGLTEGRLSQMLGDDSMQEFLKPFGELLKNK